MYHQIVSHIFVSYNNFFAYQFAFHFDAMMTSIFVSRTKQLLLVQKQPFQNILNRKVVELFAIFWTGHKKLCQHNNNSHVMHIPKYWLYSIQMAQIFHNFLWLCMRMSMAMTHMLAMHTCNSNKNNVNNERMVLRWALKRRTIKDIRHFKKLWTIFKRKYCYIAKDDKNTAEHSTSHCIVLGFIQIKQMTIDWLNMHPIRITYKSDSEKWADCFNILSNFNITKFQPLAWISALFSK